MTVPSLEEIRLALAARPGASLPAPLPRQAAVAVVLRAAGRGPEALFIRRAEREGDLWSGHVAFPGGRVEAGEGSEAAAVRETLEEVGLDLRAGERIGALDEIQAIGRGRAVGLSIRPWIFALPGGRPELRYSAEVASARWIGVADLLDPRRQAPFPYVHEGRNLVLPSLDVDGLVIWGLTYRMVEMLADVIRSPPPG